MKQKILPPKILVISRRFDFNVLDEFMLVYSWGFHAGSDGTESVCKVGNPGSIPGWERSPGEGHGNPLQYPCLGSPMDRGAWQATVHRVTKGQT